MLAGCMSFRSYVAYTVYPLGYIIDRITGGVIESKSIQSDSLVQVATILDDYEDILRNSNYLFHIGDLEPYYDIYEEDILNTGVEVVDVSELNTIYKFQRYTMVNVDGVEEFIESPYYNSDLFNMTDVNENDMMLWIDPIGIRGFGKRSDLFGCRLSESGISDQKRGQIHQVRIDLSQFRQLAKSLRHRCISGLPF